MHSLGRTFDLFSRLRSLQSIRLISTMSNKVYVVGVGMTKFEKPGRREQFDYPDMVAEAVNAALNDAKTKYEDIGQAFVGYVYGDSTCGQRALYPMGMTSIPIVNVNNNCSTGSSALFLAYQAVAGNQAKCVLATGFEKMQRGSLTSQYSDRTNPMDKHVEVIANTFGIEASPFAAQMFGNAGREHMKKYGTKPEHFAKIALKNHKHSTKNPKSQFTDEYSLDEILKSPMVHEPLTKLQCCPTSDGAAAAIVVNEEFVLQHNLQSQAVEIIGIAMATDSPSTFQENSCIKMVGYDMTRKAAQSVYAQSRTSANDYQVVELHDCFSANELITYEALGLCQEGEAGAFIDRGDNTYGGKFVVNPSGGLISKGHPLGATGLAQCAELCWQLRGLAGERQVKNCVRALQHNIGLGGAAVVVAYSLGFPFAASSSTVSAGKVEATATTNKAADVTDSGFQCSQIFQQIQTGLEKNGSQIVKQINGVIGFQVKNDAGQQSIWIVDCKNNNGSVKRDNNGKGDCTIVINDKDLVNVMTGRLNPQQAFFQGKLKITGNMGLAMKLKALQTQVESMKANL